MWEALGEILISSNAVAILLFMAFIVVFGAILSKKGLIQIHTSAVSVGSADRERDIIRQQVEWIHIHCEGFESTMHKPEGYNEWLGRYIVEKIYDECINWITFNHISASPAYVDIKAEKIVDLIHKYAHLEEFKTKEFDELIKEDVRNCIEKLLTIRKVYK